MWKHSCWSHFLTMLQVSRPELHREGLWHRCFPVDFLQFFKEPYLQQNKILYLQNIDFLWQKPQQLLGVEAKFEGLSLAL